VLRWLLEVWKAYAHRAASYQTTVLLTLVYLVVLGPMAAISKAFGGQLMDLRDGGESTWTQRPEQEKTIDALRRQF